MHGIASKQDILTKAIYVKEYSYIVVGYHSGLIRAWKLSNQRKMIHTFESHIRPVDSLTMHKDCRMFWSASSDLTIRLWNLDTFTNVYSYTLNRSISQIQLLTFDKFIAEHDNVACMGEIDNKAELLYTFYGNVTKFDKSFSSPSILKDQGDLKQMSLTLDNNSGISITSDTIRNTKILVGIFYPPPKSNQIHEIIANPFNPNTYYMLIESGEICRYRIEKETGIVENSFETESILDIENHPLGQKAAMIKFMRIFPPKIDVEINDLKLLPEEEKPISLLQLNKDYCENQLLAIGCNKGSVVFIKVS